MKTFARFKNEHWSMDLAYVDKLSKDNNDEKYLLVRRELFDRTIDAKGTRTKNSKETVRALLTMITKRIFRKKIAMTREQKLLESLKNYAELKEYKFTLQRETKAAYAERTILSLKNLLYSYMEDNGYKYTHKLTQFVTTLNSRRNCSIDLIPENVKNSDFLSNLYGKLLQEFRKPKFKIRDRVRFSKYD